VAPSKAAIAVAAAWAVCFAPALAGMAEQWWREPDMGHALCVPPVLAWVVWRERAPLATAIGRPCSLGWVLILLGAALNAAGAIGAGLFARSLGAWISAAGAVAAFGGAGLLGAARFPLALGLFMLPKMALVYNAAASPLQLLASRMAATALGVAGMAVERNGNILSLGGRAVEVEAACSGLRYLLPLLLMAAVWGWQSGARAWVRWALLPVAVVLAILTNALRVALALACPDLAAGWPHSVLGWVLFVACLAGIWAAERGLRHV